MLYLMSYVFKCMSLPRVRNLLVAIALWWHSDDPGHHIDFCVCLIIIQCVHLSNKWSASDLKDAIKCEVLQILHGWHMLHCCLQVSACDIWQRPQRKFVIRIFFSLVLPVYPHLFFSLCSFFVQALYRRFSCFRYRFNAIYDISGCQPLLIRKSRGFH